MSHTAAINAYRSVERYTISISWRGENEVDQVPVQPPMMWLLFLWGTGNA